MYNFPHMPKKKDKKAKNAVNTAPRQLTKKVCLFCESKTVPSYTDSITLRKFMNERTRIVTRQRTGACSKHQRSITDQIKYARHLSLLPFVPKI